MLAPLALALCKPTSLVPPLSTYLGGRKPDPREDELPPKLRMMANMRFHPGKGLGINQQGRIEFLQLPAHDPTFGLGYKPKVKDYISRAQ